MAIKEILLLVLVSMLVSEGMACDCSGNELGETEGTGALLDDSGGSRDALEDVLSPQLLQTYVALQLQKIAEDIASMKKLQDRASPRQLCGSRPRSRGRRFATLREDKTPDVPVVAGLAGLFPRPLRTTSTAPLALVALKSKSGAEEDDVPVFRGTAQGSQVRLISPSPTSAQPLSSTVPVVKGSSDPAHPGPGRPSPSSSRRTSSGGLQLSPEEELALTVLMEGRHRPPAGTAPVSGVSGKVGGKAPPTAVPVAAKEAPKPSRRPAPAPAPQGQGQGQGDCCAQRKLLTELERQLTLLRRLNAEHAREEEWARANTLPGSYPSPYFPYLHNLPIHPVRGMDDPRPYYSLAGQHSPALAPEYLLPPSRAGQGVVIRPRGSSGWRVLGHPFGVPREEPPSAPAPSGWECRENPTASATSASNSAARIDDKVNFSDQQQQTSEESRMRGTDPQNDDSFDPKLGEAVDVEL